MRTGGRISRGGTAERSIAGVGLAMHDARIKQCARVPCATISKQAIRAAIPELRLRAPVLPTRRFVVFSGENKQG